MLNMYFNSATSYLIMSDNANYCPDPLVGEEPYTQMGFFCSVNFCRSIYSS